MDRSGKLYLAVDRPKRVDRVLGGLVADSPARPKDSYGEERGGRRNFLKIIVYHLKPKISGRKKSRY